MTTRWLAKPSKPSRPATSTRRSANSSNSWTKYTEKSEQEKINEAEFLVQKDYRTDIDNHAKDLKKRWEAGEFDGDRDSFMQALDEDVDGSQRVAIYTSQAREAVMRFPTTKTWRSMNLALTDSTSAAGFRGRRSRTSRSGRTSSTNSSSWIST